MELGLWVEKASGPTVRTRRYFPFHECFVTKNDEAAGFMAIFTSVSSIHSLITRLVSVEKQILKTGEAFAACYVQNIAKNAKIEN